MSKIKPYKLGEEKNIDSFRWSEDLLNRMSLKNILTHFRRIKATIRKIHICEEDCCHTEYHKTEKFKFYDYFWDEEIGDEVNDAIYVDIKPLKNQELFDDLLEYSKYLKNNYLNVVDGDIKSKNKNEFRDSKTFYIELKRSRKGQIKWKDIGKHYNKNLRNQASNELRKLSNMFYYNEYRLVEICDSDINNKKYYYYNV